VSDKPIEFEQLAAEEARRRKDKPFDGKPNASPSIARAVLQSQIKHLTKAEDLDPFIEMEKPPRRIPIDEGCFDGLAGEFVRMWEPHTEADSIALLIQFLAAFGNAVGRGPFFAVSGNDHHTNLQVCILGPTSYGSKGQSLDCVKHTFKKIELQRLSVPALNLMSGLSTSEGLIASVRDELWGLEKGKEVLKFKGVTDKRKLFLETEFAQVLRRMKRESNTLSATLRQAYDGDDLQTVTKQDPMKATAPHISVIFHITRTELASQMDFDSAMNGFGNRIMFFWSERSKSLPNPGRPSEGHFASFVPKLTRAIEFAYGALPFGNETEKIVGVSEMTRSPHAELLWATLYEKLLNQPRLGRQHNAMCARARAHVLRLSMIYALLDCSATIEHKHVHRAYCLWEHAERTSRFVFGNSLGDKVAEEILLMLRESKGAGLLTREITHKVSSKDKKDVPGALRLLAENGLVHVEKIARQDGTKGKLGQRWFAKL
jgi:hypothetical protein